jgi:ATP-dependent DNA helicase RecG
VKYLKIRYPPDAIREAIINAICHRDYEMQSNVQIRIFDDRIEVWGCGPLPEPLTLEDLKKKHRSILRNPLIGRCFFLTKYIEEWGTGTNRIVEWCLKYGLPEPIFEEASGSLVVTLRKYRVSDEDLEKLNERQKSGRLSERTGKDNFG